MACDSCLEDEYSGDFCVIPCSLFDVYFLPFLNSCSLAGGYFHVFSSMEDGKWPFSSIGEECDNRLHVLIVVNPHPLCTSLGKFMRGITYAFSLWLCQLLTGWPDLFMFSLANTRHYIPKRLALCHFIASIHCELSNYVLQRSPNW